MRRFGRTALTGSRPSQTTPSLFAPLVSGFEAGADCGIVFTVRANPEHQNAMPYYQNVLHRAPDTAGAQNFINALNAGASRKSVLVGLSDSTENRINTAVLTHDG